MDRGRKEEMIMVVLAKSSRFQNLVIVMGNG